MPVGAPQWLYWRYNEKTGGARYPSTPSAGREFHFYMVVYFAAVTRLSASINAQWLFIINTRGTFYHLYVFNPSGEAVTHGTPVVLLPFFMTLRV